MRLDGEPETLDFGVLRQGVILCIKHGLLVPDWKLRFLLSEWTRCLEVPNAVLGEQDELIEWLRGEGQAYTHKLIVREETNCCWTRLDLHVGRQETV